LNVLFVDQLHLMIASGTLVRLLSKLLLRKDYIGPFKLFQSLDQPSFPYLISPQDDSNLFLWSVSEILENRIDVGVASVVPVFVEVGVVEDLSKGALASLKSGGEASSQNVELVREREESVGLSGTSEMMSRRVSMGRMESMESWRYREEEVMSR
jgi:hypothetical protein